ncbi:MAG: glutamine synthetase [Rhodospirillaceae bacterium]|jgi:glutamine synthetase|nr:glutamine synthetase [Rhodospirillaceae bacterium]MBT5245467.1 glutamine synthetase [Rhodospirillaceae bacterium]MBT5562623.1 glutamine synthetase [Rhodospirillaceae bacterium]MBT6242519.1 glutamine synthetase [Rhodospirillaceae bacterium]
MSEVSEFLDKHPDVDTFDTIIPDLCGVIRGKRIARDGVRSIYKKGFQIPGSSVFLDVRGDTDDPGGMGVTDGDPDVTAHPVAGSLVMVPWFEKPMAQLLVSFFEEDGTPYIFDPRHVLQRVLDRFTDIGLRPVVALEQEFYLLDPEGGLQGNPKPPILPSTGRRASGTQVLSISDLEGFALYLDQVAESCKIQKIPVGPVTAELATGQYEINLIHTDDPLVACDHALLLPRVVKGVARAHGVNATFMAKPYPDQSGSGMHMHVSLIDEKGNNVFSGGDETGNETLHFAVGGLLGTMADAMALFAPNINSFRRFMPGTYVPVSRSWGANNRSVAIRIPAGDDANRRLEHRIAGADANPYLALAAVLAGMHHGISKKISPPPAAGIDTPPQEDHGLPKKWHRALDVLEKSEVMADYLGKEYCDLYVTCKRDEMESFMAEASPREYEWYLRPEG